MEHFKCLFAPFSSEGGGSALAIAACVLNLAYFFGLLFGTLSILQRFGLV